MHPTAHPRRSRRSGTGLCAVLTLVLAVLAAAWSSPAAAQTGPTWVSAWSAAPQGASVLGGIGAESFSGYPVPTGVVPPVSSFDDQTVRQVMNVRYGGKAVRVQLSNQFGTHDVVFASVTVGLRSTGSAVDPSTLRPLRFGGATRVTLPAGTSTLSDPVDLAVAAFQDVVVSFYAPGDTGPATVHGNANQTFYTAAGDRAADPTGAGFLRNGTTDPRTASLTTAWYFVTGIQVAADRGARTLVVFGDSITDGLFSTGDANRRYPDVLARRLLADRATAQVSVTSEAISANRLLNDGVGPSGLSRFDQQVLGQPHVGGVLLLQGINDIGQPFLLQPAVSAQQIIEGYRQLANRAHARGVKIFVGTLTPAGDVLKPAPYGVYSTPDGVAKRAAVNAWLRGAGRAALDGVVDFDAAVRDPLLPDHLRPQYDSLDSLHPNDAGYAAMANAVPLSLLRGL